MKHKLKKERKNENMITLSWFEQLFVQIGISFLTLLLGRPGQSVSVTLSDWEQLVIGTVASLLSLLATKIKNATEQSAIQTVSAFLQQLLSGAPLEASGIQAAIAFLQKLLAGQVSTA
jgi:hypothetical protein